MRIKQTITTSVLTVLLCAAAALSQGKGMNSQEKAPGGVKVIITNNKFEPKQLTIRAGTEVTWENKEGTHTVEADNGSWTSSALTAGKTYSRRFDEPGDYPYYCAFHGSKGGHEMAGKVKVTR